MENIKNHCCHIDCKKVATRTIIYSSKPDDYTELCDQHLVQYLPNNYAVTVAPVDRKEVSGE